MNKLILVLTFGLFSVVGFSQVTDTTGVIEVAQVIQDTSSVGILTQVITFVSDVAIDGIDGTEINLLFDLVLSLIGSLLVWLISLFPQLAPLKKDKAKRAITIFITAGILFLLSTKGLSVGLKDIANWVVITVIGLFVAYPFAVKPMSKKIEKYIAPKA